VPSAFSISNVQSTAVGDVDATTAAVQLTDTIDESDVANGLVHATTVRAVASGSAKNGVRRFNSNGSGFAELSVQGFPRIDASVPPNTQLLIPGLGAPLYSPENPLSDDPSHQRDRRADCRRANRGTLSLP
jgi:hypothetical protein